MEIILKYNDFVSVGIDFIVLNLLLFVIDIYTTNNYNSEHWYINVALPIVFSVYIVLNIYLSIRFLRVNKLLKTSSILFMTNLLEQKVGFKLLIRCSFNLGEISIISMAENTA